MTAANPTPIAEGPGQAVSGLRDGRWRIWASRRRTRLELYVTAPDGSVHPVTVLLSVLLHPSVRTRGVRDDAWWGAAARTAADVVAEGVRAGHPPPPTVTVRRFGRPGARLVLVDGTMELVLELHG